MKLIFYLLAIAVIGYHGTNARHNKRQDMLVYEEDTRAEILPMDLDDEDGEACGPGQHQQCPSGRSQPRPGPTECRCVPNNKPCPEGETEVMETAGRSQCRQEASSGISVTSSLSIFITCVVTILFIH